MQHIREQLVDCHLHLSLTRTTSSLQNVAELRDILQGCGLAAICVQNIVLWQPKNLVRNPLSLLLKTQEPDRVFSFGGLRFPNPQAADKHTDFAAQAKNLLEMGVDGIKIFGKPNYRAAFGEPFDSPVFDELYSFLEAAQTPVLFHMGDPREFWDAGKTPAFARENGWLYGDGYPSFDELYHEVERLLAKFPKLNLVFPHFYFLSDALEELRAFLHRWPTVRIDITPGSEMYAHFSQQPEQARAFFLEFQDRILFGTDNTGSADGVPADPTTSAAARIETLWDFLTTNRAHGWGHTYQGLALPEDAVAKIACGNFYQFVGRSRPRPVDRARVRAYIRALRACAAEPAIAQTLSEIEAQFDQQATEGGKPICGSY